MHKLIANQKGNISITTVVFCLILGAVVFKLGIVNDIGDFFNTHLKDRIKQIEQQKESETLSKEKTDQITVEQVLPGLEVEKNKTVENPGERKLIKPTKKYSKKSRKGTQDTDEFSLAMREVITIPEQSGYLPDDIKIAKKKKFEHENINAEELYQAYLESWIELE